MKNNEKIKKNQHLVSKFLLKKFKTNNKEYKKELLVRNIYDFLSNDKKELLHCNKNLIKNVSVKDEIFVEDYFYDLTKEYTYNENYTIYVQDLEELYSVIEKHAGKCVSKLEKNIYNDLFNLSISDKENLTNLLIAFNFKGRKFYEDLEKLSKKNYLLNLLNSDNKSMIENLNLFNSIKRESHKIDETIFLLANMLHAINNKDIKVSINDCIKQMIIINNSEFNNPEKRKNYNIYIVKNSTNIDFILGDEPLLNIYNKDIINEIFKNNFECENILNVKIMPITNKLAILSTEILIENSKELSFFEIKEDKVKIINSLELFNSYKYIITTNNDDLNKLDSSIFRKDSINKLYNKLFN